MLQAHLSPAYRRRAYKRLPGRMPRHTRTICFVTGTRAEFGLMRPVLHAIRAQRGLRLRLIVTGMHLQAAHGRSIEQIRREGWTIDSVVPWASSGRKPAALAKQ